MVRRPPQAGLPGRMKRHSEAGDHIERAVSRTSVYDDMFDVWVRLGKDRGDGRFDEGFVVKDSSDYGEFHKSRLWVERNGKMCAGNALQITRQRVLRPQALR